MRIQFYTFILHLIAIALPFVLWELAHVLPYILSFLHALVERFACYFVKMFGELLGGPKLQSFIYFGLRLGQLFLGDMKWSVMMNVFIKFGLEVGEFLGVGRYIWEIDCFLCLFERMRGTVRSEDAVIWGVELIFLVGVLLGNSDERVVFIGINHSQTIIADLGDDFTIIWRGWGLSFVVGLQSRPFF